jgi:hypothetical protein
MNMKVDGMPCSSAATLKMEAAGFCESLVPVHQTTWWPIPEDRNRNCRLDSKLLTEVCPGNLILSWSKKYYVLCGEHVCLWSGIGDWTVCWIIVTFGVGVLCKYKLWKQVRVVWKIGAYCALARNYICTRTFHICWTVWLQSHTEHHIMP